MAIEIGLTQQGDWSITEQGTMSLVGNESYVLQRIMMLMRTEPGDMTFNPIAGFYMTSYLSLPNNQTTADKLISDLHAACLAIPDMQGYDVQIDAYPTSMDQMTLIVDVISPDGAPYRLSQNLSFSSSSPSRFGFTITDHTPYDSNTSKPIIELVVLSSPTNVIELAHQPLNSFIRIFDNPYALEVSGNTVNGSSTSLSGHVTTYVGLQYDASGNPFSGSIPSNTFMAEINASGNFIFNSIDNNGIFHECSVVDSSPSFADYMFNNSPTYAAIYFSGTLVAETPDVSVQKSSLTSSVMVNDFDLIMTYPNAVAEAVAVSSSVMELNKNSVSFGGRSTYRWYAQFPIPIAAGTYAVVYNTFDYR